VPQLRPSKTQKKELVAPETIEEPQPSEPLPPPIRVTAIVVSHNRASFLRRAIEALERSEERDRLEILVVDSGSTDGSAQLESDFPKARFIRMPRNFGLTKALNLGLRAATGEFLLFLHEDTEVSPDTARLLASTLETQTDVGAAAPLLVSPDGTPVPQIESLPGPHHTEINWRAADPARGDQPLEYARGAALMLRKASIQAIRQIDERYGNFGSDAELCFQVRRAGKVVLLVTSTRTVHHGREETDPTLRALREADTKFGIATYLKKHSGFFSGIRFRISAMFGALGTLLMFRDFRYHLALLTRVWSGQKIDGTQQD
jgi:N-acetylglucosaminyl-diphospho-decaprenol L-rhamnosyltransferase